MAKNQIETQLTECVREMREVEMALEEHLQLLSENVDKGFGQLRTLCHESYKFAETLTDYGHVKVATALTVATAAFSGVAGAYNAVQAARAHNEALDRMMMQKRKIALAKHKGLERISELAERHENKLDKLLSFELKNQYNEATLLNTSGRLEEIVDNIRRVAELYKVANFNLYLVNYLTAEYKAWLKYEQRSELPRPTHWNPNIDIYTALQENFIGNWQASINSRTGNGSVSGAELLLFSDPQITSCLVLDKSASLLTENSNNEISDLQLAPSGVALPLLEYNAAYNKYKEGLKDFQHWWYSYAIGGLIIVGLSIWFDCALLGWISEWWTFFKWVVMLPVVIFELVIWANVMDPVFDDEKSKEEKDKIYSAFIQQHAALAGHESIYEPDLEKKNLLEAGAKGFFDGLLS